MIKAALKLYNGFYIKVFHNRHHPPRSWGDTSLQLATFKPSDFIRHSLTGFLSNTSWSPSLKMLVYYNKEQGNKHSAPNEIISNIIHSDTYGQPQCTRALREWKRVPFDRSNSPETSMVAMMLLGGSSTPCDNSWDWRHLELNRSRISKVVHLQGWHWC